MEVCPLAPANLRPRLQSQVFNSPSQFLSLPGFLYSNPALFTKPRVGGPNLEHQSPSHPTPSSETHSPDSQGSASPLPLLPRDSPPLVTRTPPAALFFSPHAGRAPLNGPPLRRLRPPPRSPSPDSDPPPLTRARVHWSARPRLFCGPRCAAAPDEQG